MTRLSTAAAALLTTGALLTACGGSTVSSEDVTDTTVAPLERSPLSSTVEEETETSESDNPSTADEPDAGVAAPAAPAPEDRGAREISEIPDTGPELSQPDDAFLTSLRDAGVNIDGLEPQLLGTASTVCAEGAIADATAGAVAGQLVEQGRSDKPVDELTDVIVDNARAHYCP